MPRGDKSKYTEKQERKADHVAASSESRGVTEKEAGRRAWATVNKGAAAARRAGRDEALPKATPPRERAEGSEGGHRLRVPPPRVLLRPRRASATPNSAERRVDSGPNLTELPTSD